MHWKFIYLKMSIFFKKMVWTLCTSETATCHQVTGSCRRGEYWLNSNINKTMKLRNQRRKSWLLLEYNLIIPWTGCRVLTLNQLNWLRQIWLSSQSQSHDQWSALIGIDNATENNIDIMLNWELWFQNYNNVSSFILYEAPRVRDISVKNVINANRFELI